MVLDVFRAAEAPFAVKEIEKAAGAKKGLHPMQIKDLVVALVDDGKVGMRMPLSPPLPRVSGGSDCLATRKIPAAPRQCHPDTAAPPSSTRQVNSEKIGQSTYYWSFPSEASVKVRAEGERLEQEHSSLAERKASLEAEVKQRQAAAGPSEDAERERLQAVLQNLEAKEADLGRQLRAASACDPEKYRKMKEGATTARDSANRWIENIWALQSWMNKKFSGRENELKLHFKSQGVPDDLDTFE